MSRLIKTRAKFNQSERRYFLCTQSQTNHDLVTRRSRSCHPVCNFASVLILHYSYYLCEKSDSNVTVVFLNTLYRAMRDKYTYSSKSWKTQAGSFLLLSLGAHRSYWLVCYNTGQFLTQKFLDYLEEREIQRMKILGTCVCLLTWYLNAKQLALLFLYYPLLLVAFSVKCGGIKSYSPTYSSRIMSTISTYPS